VRWGERELDLTVHEGASTTWETVEAFRRLHAHAAGRSTRPVDSWREQWKAACEGDGFFVTAAYSGELVAAVYCTWSRLTCYYAVAAARRELFDKPMTHALLWASILHARASGRRYFEMGEIHFPAHDVEPKLAGISMFKRGFGGALAPRLHVVYEGVPKT